MLDVLQVNGSVHEHTGYTLMHVEWEQVLAVLQIDGRVHEHWVHTRASQMRAGVSFAGRWQCA